MKTKLSIITTFASLFLILQSCTLDNFDGPDAQVIGAIRDSIDMNTLVEQDLISGSVIGVYEMSYTNPTLSNWRIMENGTYTNNLVFSNTYDIYLRNANFFPYTVKGQEIKSGQNTLDFMVYPYIRIKNPAIVLSPDGKTVTATFSLEAGKAGVKVSTIKLFAFGDMHVGFPLSFALAGANTSKSLSNILIDNTITYTLSVDLTANSSLFQSSRSYYFRIGAIAGALPITTGGTIRYNYAPTVSIALP
ncbi:MAG: DUF3823 domain-containing protein [Paludibacter sp.]